MLACDFLADLLRVGPGDVENLLEVRMQRTLQEEEHVVRIVGSPRRALHTLRVSYGTVRFPHREKRLEPRSWLYRSRPLQLNSILIVQVLPKR